MKDFRRLKVRQKSHRLALDVYAVSVKLPREELYGLTSRIRRAATSIPTNIAEGCGRNSDGDFGRFLGMAMGSAGELEYLLLLAQDLEFLKRHDVAQVANGVEETKRMPAALIAKLKADR